MYKVYYFTAAWCSPCKTFGPIIEESGIPYQKVDIDNDTELSAKYGVRSVPTLLKVNSFDQAVGDRIVGVQSVDNVKKWYNG